MKRLKAAIQARAIIARLTHHICIIGLTVVLPATLVSCTATQQPRSAASPQAQLKTQPTEVDVEWQGATTQNTKEAYIAFVRKHRDTRYSPQLLDRLWAYGTPRQQYAVAAILAQSETPRTVSKAKITKDLGGGRLEVDGLVERLLNPMTGSFENLFWNPGAEHTILCTLTMEGYTFLSATDNPLVFHVTVDRGYVYKSGHGLVIEPDGTIASLQHTDLPSKAGELATEGPKDILPRFTNALNGRNPVRIRNPNEFSVRVGIRSGNGGKDFGVAGNGVQTVYVPDGRYDIYFVYSNRPDALFQGDSFTLKGNGVEIKIVKVVGGNYGIRQVK